MDPKFLWVWKGKDPKIIIVKRTKTPWQDI